MKLSTVPSPVHGLSPLEELDRSFLALSQAGALTLPASLVCDEPDQPSLTLDRVRAYLAHAGTGSELRARTWSEVVRRAQRFGDPWSLAAVAMTVPVLWRLLARQARPVGVERAEIEQEALAAVAAALPEVDANGQRPDRELFRAADRAVHRLLYAARRRAEREHPDVSGSMVREACDDSAVLSDGCGEPVDEYSLLALAAQARVISRWEARVIARSRLEGESMQALADEWGVSRRGLYRHRAAAEEHLTAYLERRMCQV